MFKVTLIQKQKDVVANVLIDKVQTGFLMKSEKEAAWKIAEKMLESRESVFYFKKYEIQLICNSLIRYKNRYRHEEELSNECFRIYNNIITCCREI